MSLLRNLLVLSACAGYLLGAPNSSVAEDNARGEELFQLCESCHGPTAEGIQMYLAPAIAGMDAWHIKAQLHKFQDGLRGTHFDDLAGMRMRPMSLSLRSDADLDAVAEYVANLPKAKPSPTVHGGDSQKGEAAYAVCAACHGAAGEGNEALSGPALIGQSDWYMKTQLENFKAGIRGANPADATGIMMRPMAMMLADDQAVKDMLAYIATLNK